MNFKQAHSSNFCTNRTQAIKYIVIHYVGAVSTAANNASYYANNRLSASAHYFVDEKEIWQSVEEYNAAWHCGGPLQGPNGHAYFGICQNSNSIGIEMCVKKKNGKWYFEPETVSNTIWLTKQLMKKYNIPIENVIRHYDVTGKICPEPYVNETIWKEFKKMLSEVKELTSANDIVWELAQRGLISDKEGMLKEINENPTGRLYWLARKTLHCIRELEG